ncbi:winged helix-turn-helix domain-containing protein [Luteimicrobium sp. NPDC057192]|uniref:winged helix-turn-helix domain-containing protein n=1 Tax=Luteimicrobium sp. NPDC057192 TaxID=3346042 RepID=UPI003632629A
MTLVSDSRPAAQRAPRTSPPGFVLYVGVDPQTAHRSGELVELAETLSEFAREWLPDAETYTALRLTDAPAGLAPATRDRTAAPARPTAPHRPGSPAARRVAEAPAVRHDDVSAFRERLAHISTVPRLVIDTRGRSVTVDDRSVHLTYKEFELLVHLARSPERPVTRDELLDTVWGHDAVREGTRTIDVHVRRVREKLDVGHVITTVRGVGYRFATAAEVVLQG